MPALTEIFRLELPDAARCAATGRALAALLRPGDVVALSGPLGAGKTTFARGVIAGLAGVDDAPSPSYTLVETYDWAGGALRHFDFYRLEKPEDAYELGVEEAFGDGVSIVEWPERAAALIPDSALWIRIDPSGAVRRAIFAGAGEWRDRLAPLAPGRGIADNETP